MIIYISFKELSFLKQNIRYPKACSFESTGTESGTVVEIEMGIVNTESLDQCHSPHIQTHYLAAYNIPSFR